MKGLVSIFLPALIVRGNERPHKKSLVDQPVKLKNSMRAGGFILFFICFVWPSPAAAYNFKAIKQSTNKTKLFL